VASLARSAAGRVRRGRRRPGRVARAWAAARWSPRLGMLSPS